MARASVGKREGEGRLREGDMRGWEETREGLGVKAGEGEERGRGGCTTDLKSSSHWRNTSCVCNKGGKERDWWSMLLL